MKSNICTIFLPLGIALGFLLPYTGLELSRWTFIFLLILMFLNFFKIDISWMEFSKISKGDVYTLFFSYFFIPSLFVSICHLLNLAESITIGFFLTNLAPFAIIAPQFLKLEHERKNSLKLIIISTIIFPVYFTLMFILFFRRSIRINSLSLFKDAFLLILIPLIASIFFKKFKYNLYGKKYLLNLVPCLNMIIIGILCFIYTGSSFLKNNFSSLTTTDFFILVGLAILQDFGTYFISKIIMLTNYQRVTLSAKNVALTGIFATIFFPRSILPIVIVLGVHFLLFNFFYFLNLNSISNE